MTQATFKKSSNDPQPNTFVGSVKLLGAWWAPALWLSGMGVFASSRAGSSPGRDTFFNINQPWIVYVFMAALVGLLTYGFVRHASLWMIGRPTDGVFQNFRNRLKNVGRFGLGQDRVRRDRYAGIMHW